jgi:hypothetical protein
VWRRCHAPRRAVGRPTGGTGDRVAVIVALSDQAFLKLIGIGMASAIAIDATLLRMVSCRP